MLFGRRFVHLLGDLQPADRTDLPAPLDRLFRARNVCVNGISARTDTRPRSAIAAAGRLILARRSTQPRRWRAVHAHGRKTLRDLYLSEREP